MSITGRSLREASSTYADHLNRMLNLTLTHRRLISYIERGDDVSTIQFRQAGRAVPVQLNSQFGPVHLEITLRCVAISADRRQVGLRAAWYRYTLLPEGQHEPMFRWEYVSAPDGEDAFWARHHLQGPAPINVGSQYVSLNDLHVPTGPVAIEEVVRFCINDLGVAPLADDWHTLLIESAEVSRQIAH